MIDAHITAAARRDFGKLFDEHEEFQHAATELSRTLFIAVHYELTTNEEVLACSCFMSLLLLGLECSQKMFNELPGEWQEMYEPPMNVEAMLKQLTPAKVRFASGV